MVSETALLQLGLTRLRTVLPPGWRAEARPSPRGVDLVVEVQSPDGVSGALRIEVKDRLGPGMVAALRAQLERYGAGAPVVFAGWLSPLTQQLLREAGLGYLDLTGNLEIRLDRPGLYLKDVGADRDPEPVSSALKSLKGAGAARAIRALVDFVPPYGIRELAAASGASAPVLSRVVALLEGERLVARDGAITEVAWAQVLARWAEDYDFLRANRVVTALDPTGAAALVRKLARYEPEWAATGSLGAPPAARVVPVQVATVYVRSPEAAMEALDLAPTASGANVLLVEPPDDGPFARAARGEDGVVRCAPSQVAADLLTGPGRGEAEARPVLEWMRSNLGAWRRRP